MCLQALNTGAPQRCGHRKCLTETQGSLNAAKVAAHQHIPRIPQALNPLPTTVHPHQNNRHKGHHSNQQATGPLTRQPPQRCPGPRTPHHLQTPVHGGSARGTQGRNVLRMPWLCRTLARTLHPVCNQQLHPQRLQC